MAKETYLYLAKSNRANKYFIERIRTQLGKIPYKEHLNNEFYNENKLINASYCIVILESNTLGKGVFEQITRLKQYKIPFKIIFPYTTVDGIESIYAMESNFTMYKTSNDNDYINWGKITSWGTYKRFPYTNLGFDDALESIRLSEDYQKFMSKVNFEKLVDSNIYETDVDLNPTHLTYNSNGEVIESKVYQKVLTVDDCYPKNFQLLLKRRN